jgi:hypothetical protein
MSTNDTNTRYEAIVDAALTFFTILVGLKLADLIDQKGMIGVDKWPCFIAGVAVLLRYVSGSFNHQRAQYVNQPQQHDRQFLFDLAFLIAFGIIAVWTCESDTVTAFLNRLIVFTAIALAWTVWNLVFARLARASNSQDNFSYLPWFFVNLVQLCVLWGTKIMWPSGPIISAMGFEYRSLWMLSVVLILLLFWDLQLQLHFHHPLMKSHAAAPRAA